MEKSVQKNNSVKWLYLDLNSYFASVEQQLRPETRGRPTIVVPLMSDHTSAIAASYEAKALGIKTNTFVRDAKKICKDLCIIEADHQKYIYFHHKIKEEIDKFIPIEIVCSIDEFACKLEGNECSYNGSVDLAKRIKAGIKENIGEYIRCSIGVAQNRLLAKIASNIKKPDGLTIFMPEQVPNILSNVSFSDIPGIGRNMEKRLAKNNIHSMEDILKIDPKHLRKIWHSVWGERFWYLIRGYEIPELPTNKRTVGHSHVLDPKLRAQNKAHIVAQRLTLKAASRLRRLGYYTKSIHLSFRIENGERLSAHKNFYRCCDNFNIKQNMDYLWQKLTSQINSRSRIKKISVTLFNLMP